MSRSASLNRGLFHSEVKTHPFAATQHALTLSRVRYPFLKLLILLGSMHTNEKDKVRQSLDLVTILNVHVTRDDISQPKNNKFSWLVSQPASNIFLSH